MTAESANCPTGEVWIAERYQVQASLGRGGMGAVYRVFDDATGKTVALKQLHKEVAEAKPEHVALFQHEYYTLAQLAHPLIIEVYDFGVDEQGPYYTMELLTGSDLRQMTLLPWQQACALLRDVASGLAILHSRRLVHRDVTERNVRCTDKGRAKLIDFGAMIPMGSVKRVVGTPPFVPPEAVNRQPMDGRADLFSLGALAYRLLTGRHAFPARTIAELRDLWRSRPVQPSVLVPEVPLALDTLVISLLSLDRLARPVNAAEVIDRLTGMAALPQSEPLGLSQAYLITPPLAGRERLTTLFRKLMPQVLAGRGGTIVVEGAPGVGRSRLLSSLVLEGKVAGATVLTANADDARQGDYGVVRALVEDLLDAAPAETLEVADEDAAVLAHVLPVLHSGLGWPKQVRFENPEQQRTAVQQALLSLLTSSCTRRCLLIAVDDVHFCDEPSAAVLAALGRSAHRLKLVVAATAETAAGAAVSRPVQMLRESGTRIKLDALNRRDIQGLIGSVFGEVTNTNIVADWAYDLSRGNPGTCMELAQHLVDRDIARYEDGRWILPADLRQQALPRSLEQTLDARVAKLGASARTVAEALSLVTEHAPLRLEHYAVLSSTQEQKVLYAALDELVASQVLVSTGEHYLFAQSGLVEALHRGLDDKRRRQIHARLAVAYEYGNYLRPFVLVHHLQQAGQGERALELLLPLVESVSAMEEPFALQVQCCETALALAEAQVSSPRDRFFLRRRLVRLARKFDVSLLRHADKAAEQLRKDSGLIFWDQLDDAKEPSERIRRCLAMAQDRWESAPERERGLTPREAMQQLAVLAFLVHAVAIPTFDIESLSRLPELLAPLRTLSPGIDFLARILEMSRDSMTGHSVQSVRQELLKLSEKPIPGVDEEARKSAWFGMSYYDALAQASAGNQDGLKGADTLEKDPRYAAHAWEVRLVTHLYAGNTLQAQACRERKELLAIQNPESDAHLLFGLVWEAWALGANGDLMGLKELLVPIAEKAEVYPGWLPFLLAVRGDYHRLRGELQEARADLERALELAPIGKHFAWHRAIPVLVETLLEMGQHQEARDLAFGSLETCQQSCRHEQAMRDLNRVLALADAKLGKRDEAFRRIEATIEKEQAAGVAGVPLGLLYEAAAWTAMEAQDEDALNLYASLAAEQYLPGKNPALVARLLKLVEESDLLGSYIDAEAEVAMGLGSERTATETAMTFLPRLRSALEECQTFEHRGQVALDLLMEHTGTSEGYLYARGSGGLHLVAPSNRPDPPGLVPQLTAYWGELTSNLTPKTVTTTADVEHTIAEQCHVLVNDEGHIFQPVVFSAQRDGSSEITAIAALRIRVGTPVNPTANLVAILGEHLSPDSRAKR